MTQRASNDVDVLIIGAGPTGLTLANLLGSVGVRTMIVESRETTSDLPRAIVLDDEGARTLQACGLADEAVANALPGEGSQYESADGRVIARVGPGATEFGFGKRQFILQPKLERTLDVGLARWPTVDRRFGSTLRRFSATADGVRAVIAGADGERTVAAQWLIACDGGRSPIREALEIPFAGSTYSQDWLVLDLSRDHQSGAYSRFICDPARPTVIVPAPAGCRRYEFMLVPGESRDEATRPEFIGKLLAPFQPFDPAEVVRAVVYTFHARVAERWRVGRVILAGDAAHLTPPFAGQGMNAGLRDASNLAWKLAAHVSGLAGPELLDSYEEERRAPCLAMIELAVLMGKVIMPRSEAEAALQNAISVLTEGAPALRQYLYEMRFKPRPYYEQGALVRQLDDVPASLVGHMLPQPWVRRDGAAVRLDEVIGPGFALIGQDSVSARHAIMTHGLWGRLRPRTLHLGPEPSGATGPDVLACDDPTAAPLRAHRDQLMLVRPDRYVAGAFSPADADRFAEAFAQRLRPATRPAVAEARYELVLG